LTVRKRIFLSTGTVEGGTQLQEFRSVGTSDQAVNSNLTLTQGTYVYVTVVAVNAAGLRSMVLSEPSLVDKTPPVIAFVRDGSSDKGKLKDITT